ncbi:MAG: acyl-ACP--UDP-N-acetylglucosamine O-acyltransferase [Bacteroidales bacterium]|nr:acyl-ACP--UDP-N-acetylglucosamine O-acyltransferase [Bacteroidales bacterium]MBR6280276.1 acyl-ACP--UDP-N-acetylglucosamine O-acyltransferase [Bacteroidales bacterium]
MTTIHPLATVSPDAKLGENVQIGPYAFIDSDVEIGDNTVVHPHAVIYRYVRIGRDCEVFPGAVVGAIPQDLKFDGEITYVEIGDRVTIRECATVNRGTKASGKGITRIGDDTLVMSYVHVAHDCRVGRHCILVSYVGLAGETDVDDWAIIGGSTVVHQFSKIGAHAMIGGGSRVNKDIPPYSLCGREPVSFAGVNLVGLRRRGFSAETIRNIKDIYDTIYYQGFNITDGCARVEAGFPPSEERDTILGFIRNSKRGIVRAADLRDKSAID